MASKKQNVCLEKGPINEELLTKRPRGRPDGKRGNLSGLRLYQRGPGQGIQHAGPELCAPEVRDCAAVIPAEDLRRELLYGHGSPGPALCEGRRADGY